MSHDVTTKKLRAGENTFDIFIMLLSIILLVLAYQISGFAVSGPGTFPLASTSVMVASMLFVLLGNRKKKKTNPDGFVSECTQAFKEIFTKDFLIFTIICIAYVTLIEPLHFTPSSFLFLALSIIYLKGARPVKSVIISAGTLAVIYVIFLYFFKVLLP